MRTLILAALAALLLGREAEAVLPKPSGNAGKPGVYQVETGTPGYSYYVSVPARPLADADYGLHLFFHGQNNQDSAKNTARWQAKMLDANGLIGINMCYADGDNLKDTAGKAAAARAAALQVMADYPVVPGRGMIGCFSGGGAPCAQWFAEDARNRGLAWPFTAQALYSCMWRTGMQSLPATGWYVGVNADEWNLGNFGETQPARFAEALGSIPRSGPDHRFLVLPHVGHTVPEQGIAAAAALFRRIDLAYAPYIHLASLPKPLQGVAATANAGQLGAAWTALGRLPQDDAAAGLRARLDARAAAQVALVADLAADDALLASWYGGIFAKGLKGHPREAELKAALAGVSKERRAAAAAALDAFVKGFPHVFAGGAMISAQAVPMLEQVVKGAGEKSLYGGMAGELLALPRAPSPR